MRRRARTPQQLEALLAVSVRDLGAACIAFDSGDSARMLNIGVLLRTLFHDKPGTNSRALVVTAGRDTLQVPTTSVHPLPGHHGSFLALAAVLLRAELPRFVPAGHEPTAWLPWRDWWNEAVIVNECGHEYSRAEIVRSLADHDLAHVDSTIPETWAQLTQDHLIARFFAHEGRLHPVPGSVEATIRQIAQEALLALSPEEMPPTPRFNGLIVYGDSFTAPQPLCLCGSGKLHACCHRTPPWSDSYALEVGRLREERQQQIGLFRERARASDLAGARFAAEAALETVAKEGFHTPALVAQAAELLMASAELSHRLRDAHGLHASGLRLTQLGGPRGGVPHAATWLGYFALAQASLWQQRHAEALAAAQTAADYLREASPTTAPAWLFPRFLELASMLLALGDRAGCIYVARGVAIDDDPESSEPERNLRQRARDLIQQAEREDGIQ